MSLYVLSAAARGDILNLWSYYAEALDNLEAAEKIREEIHTKCEFLARHPFSGHRRADLTPKEVRFTRVRDFLIIYRPTSPLQIVRILHGARDITRLLKVDR